MRIIIANYRYFVGGGPDRYMFKFMDVAEKHGIECIPFSVRYSRNQPSPYANYFALSRGGGDETQYEDIKMTPKNVWRMLNCTIYNFDAKRRLKSLIRNTRPDCVYIIHAINSLSPAIIDACKEEGVRVIHRISDFFLVCANRELLHDGKICEKCVDGCLKESFKRRCVKQSLSATLIRIAAMKVHKMLKIYQKVDAWVVPSEFTLEMICRKGLDREKFHHIPTFINSEKITPCYEHDNYVLFLGRLSKEKGAIYAIQAMIHFKGSIVRLKITGTPNPMTDKMCLDFIKQNELDNVDFVGFKAGDELIKLISRAMCIVCPAVWYENMPNTVVESYAYGKPVVASRLGSLAEIVQDGKTGFLFRPKDSDELAEKLKILAEDHALVERLGRAARQRCEAEFGAEEHFEKVLRLLQGDLL